MKKYLTVFACMICIVSTLLACSKKEDAKIPDLDVSKTTIVTGQLSSIFDRLVEVSEALYLVKDEVEDKELIETYNLSDSDFKNGIFKRQTGQSFKLTLGDDCDFILLENGKKKYEPNFDNFLNQVYDSQNETYVESYFKFYIDNETSYVIRIKELN